MRVTLVPPCMYVRFSPVFSMPGVEVADDRLAAQHFLAAQLEHQPQHAMRARVLRTHVDDHRLILGRIDGEVAELGGLGLAHPQHRADLAQQLACRQFAAWLQSLLGVVAGLDGVDDAHVPRSEIGRELHGDRAAVVVLAQRVAFPILGHQDAGEVGMVAERDAEHVEHLSLHRLGARVEVEQRVDRRIIGRHLHAQTDAAGARLNDSRLTTTSNRSAAMPSGSCRSGISR